MPRNPNGPTLIAAGSDYTAILALVALGISLDDIERLQCEARARGTDIHAVVVAHLTGHDPAPGREPARAYDLLR
jgi:hypothetical protein